MFDGFRQDLVFAARSLLRTRTATAVAVLSLAVGIAANATIFSLVDAVEFPRLLYPRSSRLVFLEARNDKRALAGMPVSAPDAFDVLASTHSLDPAALTADQSSILREGAPRRIAGRRVSPPFFAVLDVPAALGRVLTDSDGQDAIVLSDGMWRRAFGADASILGRAIHLDGGLVTVVGVMPPRFDPDAEFWVRLVGAPAARDNRQFTVFARLTEGSSLDAAARDVEAISRRLQQAHPSTNDGWTIAVTPLARMHGRDSRQSFLLLQAAVAVVLLIACANIANILLARGTRRTHEIALRLSLGATRARVIRALLVESLLLASAGGALGVAASMWAIRVARTIGGFPDALDPRLNTTVVAFTAALSMLTGILCGIAPAAKGSAVAPQDVLRAGDGRSTAGKRRSRAHAALVAAQIANALVLVTCGSLTLQSLLNRTRVDLGFDPRNAIRAELQLPPDRYRDPGRVRTIVARMLERLQGAPGIQAAGAATWALPTAPGGQRELTLPADHDTALAGGVRRGVEAVTPRYFDALGAPIVRGRAFTDADGDGSAPVAIVNTELAYRLWPNRDPVGQPLRLGAPASGAPIVTVVGVVSTIRRSGMHDVPIARAYLPYAQYPNASLTLVARGRGDTSSLERRIVAAIQSADATLLLERTRTLADDVGQFLAPVRLVAWLLAAFGLTGLALAALGVFGTMSYIVSQREREMAVRAALGAGRKEILRLVFTSAAGMTIAGVVAGVGLALAATRLLTTFLFGISPHDPATIAGVVAVLAAVSAAACYGPARAAAAADPLQILK
jgi:putative ABC transport system permease protein